MPPTITRTGPIRWAFVMRRLLKWVGGGLLVVVVLAGAAGWWLMPVVNVPLRPLLAQLLPAMFPLQSVDTGLLEQRLRVPEGFRLGVYAAGLRGARMLRFTRGGDLLVALPADGRIVLLGRDRDGDGVADGSRDLLVGLDGPNGLDFHADWLYIAEQRRVVRVPFDHASGTLRGGVEMVIADLPGGGNHWKKTLRFGPDGKLWLSIGSSCNVCIEPDPRRATIMRFEADGSGGVIHASGLRNSAGFDWRPSDHALYATDNGRDLLGDDFPPCELNRIEEGAFYGWPFANGNNEPDPDLGAQHADDIARAQRPVFAFRAHNAPLGILFPRSGVLPAAYRDVALVALHGSWNRSRKDGYKVVALHFGAHGVEERDFITGFLEEDVVIGRPAELAEGADGAIYVADDFAGVVYRVSLRDGAAPVTTSPAAAAAATPLPSLAATSALAADVVDAQLVARGATLFSPCAACHAGAGRPTPVGQGNAQASDAKVVLQALGARHDVASLVAYLERPQPPMPPVADAEARLALAHYLLANFR